MTNSISKTDVVYDNIKKRRTEIGMSQSELAKLVGYSDKTMISKIERGVIDLPLPKLNAIAKALNVSPSILLGWDIMPETKEIRKIDVDVAMVDASIITKFSMLTQDEQVQVMQYMDFLLSKH